MQNSEATKKQRGRPATGTAKSDADRARAYRLRAVDRDDMDNERCTFNQLLMRLADLHKKEVGNYWLIRLVLEELTVRSNSSKSSGLESRQWSCPCATVA